MTWVKLEDRFPWHRKVRGLDDGAFRLHVSAICWSVEHLTDGHIPTDDLPLVSDVKRPSKAVDELTRRGLWDPVDTGWLIHDFLEFNESRTTVLARREADAERKRRGREGRTGAGTPRGVQPDAGTDSTPESARTDPARPEPNRSSGTRKRATATPDVFPITPEMSAWGQENAPHVTDPHAETRRFLDWTRANGKTYKDWTAAWRNWMSKADGFATERPARRAPNPNIPETDEWRLG